jgi:hypothetical protein
MRERSTRPDRKYAAIPNEAMRDKRLSAEARGTLAMLMTFSDDWHFHRDYLMDALNIGRDKFQKIMRELSSAGYVELVPVRGDGGHLSGTTWIIRDDPTESLKTRSSAESLKNRQPVKPTAGKSGPLRIPTDQENQPTEENQDLFGSIEPQSAREQEKPKTDAFDRFWAAFPKCERKTERLKAKAAFERIVAGKVKGSEPVDPEIIIGGMERWAASGPDLNYAPLPTTWLNGQRWEQWQAPIPDRRARFQPPSHEEVFR